MNIERYLPEDVWAAARAEVLAMPRETPLQAATYQRARWTLSLFFICGLRMVTSHMGKFSMRSHPKTGTKRWWLTVVGEGDKKRDVTVTEELVAELRAYRLSLGLPALPDPGESSPPALPSDMAPVQPPRIVIPQAADARRRPHTGSDIQWPRPWQTATSSSTTFATP